MYGIKRSHKRRLVAQNRICTIVSFEKFPSVQPSYPHAAQAVLKPVHTGDCSRRFQRQFVAENGDCRRKVRLSPNSATVAVFGDSRTFLRQCGQGLTTIVAGVAVPSDKFNCHYSRQCGRGFRLHSIRIRVDTPNFGTTSPWLPVLIAHRVC